jgi:hypothetical protein
MNLEASLLELQRQVSQRGLAQKVQVALEGSHIRIRLLGENRSLFIGYRAGLGHFLVSDPGEPPNTFFPLDQATIAHLLPAGPPSASHGRATERLKDHLLFVSYARHDEAIVKPLVALLRVAKPEVFRDEDSIHPGDVWQKVIRDAIERCTEFVLFWCSHSAISSEVEREYKLALHLDKRVVPVLLDGSDLNESLRERQVIDMRHFHQHKAKPADDERDRGRAEDEAAGRYGPLALLEDAALYFAEELGEVLEAEPPKDERPSSDLRPAEVRRSLGPQG